MSTYPENVRHLVDLGYEDPYILRQREAERQAQLESQLQEASRLLKEGRFLAAQEAVDRLLGTAPQWTAPRRLAAHLCFALKDYGGTRSHLDWLERQGMEHAELALLRAHLALGRRDWKGAASEAEYADFLEADPAATALVRGESLWRQGDYDGADAIFERAARTPRYAPQALAGRAALALRRGAWEQAIDRSLDALDQSMDAPSVHYRLGIALARTGRFAEAETALLAAARLQPSWAGPFRKLAQIAVQLGNAQQAEQWRAEGRQRVRQRRSQSERKA